MEPSNLLIIHQGALGDFVLIFPAIMRLKAYYDRIDVLCRSPLGRLAKALGIVENHYPLEAACVASLFTEQVDPLIKELLTPYRRIILFSLSAQLEKSINRITNKPSCRIPPRPPLFERVHLTDFVLTNLMEHNLLNPGKTGQSDICVMHPRKRRRDPQQILLHPGAGSVRKRWPISNFIDFAAELIATGLKTQFILGPAEMDLAGQLRSSGCTVHVLNDLLELLDLYQSAGGYIGNDSGASHLAAFLGLPAAVIFGPADPVRWRPVGPAVEVVRPELPCRPCFETEKDNCEDPVCLDETTVREVLAAFYRVYSAADGNPA